MKPALPTPDAAAAAAGQHQPGPIAPKFPDRSPAAGPRGRLREPAGATCTLTLPRPAFARCSVLDSLVTALARKNPPLRRRAGSRHRSQTRWQQRLGGRGGQRVRSTAPPDTTLPQSTALNPNCAQPHTALWEIRRGIICPCAGRTEAGCNNHGCETAINF